MSADGLNDEIARQRDRAQASLRDRDAQLSETERCLHIERQEAAATIRAVIQDAELNARRAEKAEAELAMARLGAEADVESELLESDRGLFVPIPAGHMLSVTVTPYDSVVDADSGSPS